MVAKLRLQFLVYSEVPSERLVFINNRKYLEGQSIEGDVAVERITPEGAVLSYHGERFVLRAESMGPR
jgi:Type II secretion system protein B